MNPSGSSHTERMLLFDKTDAVLMNPYGPYISEAPDTAGNKSRRVDPSRLNNVDFLLMAVHFGDEFGTKNTIYCISMNIGIILQKSQHKNNEKLNKYMFKIHVFSTKTSF